MVNIESEILQMANEKGLIKTRDIVVALGVSRQHASNLLAKLVSENKLVKLGVTRGATYITIEYLSKNPAVLKTRFVKDLENVGLEEHLVLDEIERGFPPLAKISDNLRSIFVYAFSEMLNNAIEHSNSKKIRILVEIEKNDLFFVVDDFGVGVFRNIMRKLGLADEQAAVQALLKGKMTTAPKLHSGEGIFFTSKVADEFVLDSYGGRLIINNKIDDVFYENVQGQKQGTRVEFRISLATECHLNDIFGKYSVEGDGGYGFDKTEIRVKLYTLSGIHISRSQARRILSGLEKFKVIILDYREVPMVGQAFADEIYRVFKNKYPQIDVKNENMNESVEFMVKRAVNEAKR